MGQRLSTREAVAAHLAALNAHDADRVAACVSPGFVTEPTSSGGVSRTPVPHAGAVIEATGSLDALRTGLVGGLTCNDGAWPTPTRSVRAYV